MVLKSRQKFDSPLIEKKENFFIKNHKSLLNRSSELQGLLFFWFYFYIFVDLSRFGCFPTDLLFVKIIRKYSMPFCLISEIIHLR